MEVNLKIKGASSGDLPGGEYLRDTQFFLKGANHLDTTVYTMNNNPLVDLLDSCHMDVRHGTSALFLHGLYALFYFADMFTFSCGIYHSFVKFIFDTLKYVLR